jgi:hypothetical protein
MLLGTAFGLPALLLGTSFGNLPRSTGNYELEASGLAASDSGLFFMTEGAKTSTFSAEPPSIAELAERTRRSTPPPPREYERGDSILPAILDANALDDLTPPAPFDLVHGRPSYANLVERRLSRAYYAAALAGIALVSVFAIAAPRVRLAAPAARAEAPRRSMTPAQAASWATAPFTVDVPVENSTAPRPPAPAAREAGPPLAHFDLEAAAVALAEAKSALSECERSDDGTIPASARIAVTFSPKGNVTVVSIDPASEVGALPPCVLQGLRAVRVAPFAGPSVTVRTMVPFFRTGTHE